MARPSGTSAPGKSSVAPPGVPAFGSRAKKAPGGPNRSTGRCTAIGARTEAAAPRCQAEADGRAPSQYLRAAPLAHPLTTDDALRSQLPCANIFYPHESYTDLVRRGVAETTGQGRGGQKG